MASTSSAYRDSNVGAVYGSAIPSPGSAIACTSPTTPRSPDRLQGSREILARCRIRARPFVDSMSAGTARHHGMEQRSMRKLVVTEFISLDGVMEAPGGEDDYVHGAWTMPFWADESAPSRTRS